MIINGTTICWNVSVWSLFAKPSWVSAVCCVRLFLPDLWSVTLRGVKAVWSFTCGVAVTPKTTHCTLKHRYIYLCRYSVYIYTELTSTTFPCVFQRFVPIEFDLSSGSSSPPSSPLQERWFALQVQYLLLLWIIHSGWCCSLVLMTLSLANFTMFVQHCCSKP